MKSKTVPVTLKAISNLIDEKLVFTNTKIIGIYGELDGIKQQIVGLDFKLNLKIDKLDKKVDDGFNAVFDGLEELGKNTDRNLEPRIKRLKTKLFAN